VIGIVVIVGWILLSIPAGLFIATLIRLGSCPDELFDEDHAPPRNPKPRES